VRVASPDGREWEVRAYLLRFPRWREGGHDAADEVLWLVLGFLESLVRGLLIPLALIVIEAPVAVARGLFGRTGWVDAVCRWPGEIRITWRTTRAARRPVAEEIARRLEQGYDDLTPEGAELVEMTKPPGADDLDA
jgi:hypothetical protein